MDRLQYCLPTARLTRLARVVAVGVPHHVTQGGNDRQTLFETETDLDHIRYLEALRVPCQQQQISLLGEFRRVRGEFGEFEGQAP